MAEKKNNKTWTGACKKHCVQKIQTIQMKQKPISDFAGNTVFVTKILLFCWSVLILTTKQDLAFVNFCHVGNLFRRRSCFLLYLIPRSMGVSQPQCRIQLILTPQKELWLRSLRHKRPPLKDFFRQKGDKHCREGNGSSVILVHNEFWPVSCIPRHLISYMVVFTQ